MKLILKPSSKKNKTVQSRWLCAWSILFLCLAQAKAENPIPAPTASQLKLPGLFSDNMVLQQGASVPIWGWGAEGETVTVIFRDQKISTKVKDGQWQVRLRNLQVGNPETLTIKAGDTLQFTNVLVGEVWLCSGQSNMGRTMLRTFQPEADIASATNTMIRLFTVPNVKADAPSKNVGGSWKLCSPQTITNFSAVGYYFGRDLQSARHVPVGLIESDWGGTPARAWISATALEANPRLKKEIIDTFPASRKKYIEDKAVYDAAKAEAQRQKKEFNQRAPFTSWRPGELYNGMIAPLMPFAIKGVIWYQGESDVSRANQYRELFRDLVRDWRRDWAEGDFPFLCVQIAPFKEIKSEPGESELAELREAQWLTTKTLPKMGMAVITDVGDEKNIHPEKKAPVGARLALVARAIAYGEKNVYSGPIYKNMNIRGSKVILTFDHVDGGLTAPGALQGFSICGSDKKFVWAQAEIRPDNTVTVWSPEVSQPVAVRYGWADYPVVNLWNKAGLPASPFRTDDFPMITGKPSAVKN
ncbi:MAG: sialate O-acetylesterase [Verrucomicrobiota bacterium]